ncbi:alpha/beta hydrolase [Streptomyces sp. R302]|uniref:alpha/beta fold hydrolase n=1 Tax=unclassified Streptomyces TaxID=2593676 RepID=UPI00145EB2E0|nr:MULTISPECIES: alpha/beta hydrolase [unclassified Streptomyces]NML50916.1 alpha/beta hydrolase [Streptomyces sp. R301]NML81010.1 alpha/beta hydrolase [Streptomyces sp. R302]
MEQADIGGQADFFAAYDEMLRRWPADVTGIDVPSPYGSTRVHACGPATGAPLVLLPGGGTTSMVWFGNVADLARDHRVYAVDLMGDIGRSVHDGAPLRGAKDLMVWLDAVLEGLGLGETRLCGHSYGAAIALRYALHAPRRVSRLALLDPTDTFAGLSPRYLLRALPTLLRPTPARQRAFLSWETGRPPEDPAWQDFLDSTTSAARSKVVALRRPRPEDLRACTVPTLVLLAGRSRAHDARRVAATARDLLPEADVTILPTATHHSIPTEQPAELNRLLARFLV